MQKSAGHRELNGKNFTVPRSVTVRTGSAGFISKQTSITTALLLLENLGRAENLGRTEINESEKNFLCKRSTGV